MLKLKNSKLKKFTSIALATAMLMCSLFVMSANAAEPMEIAETEDIILFTIPVFPILDESDSSDSNEILAATVCCNIITGTSVIGTCSRCNKQVSKRTWNCGRLSFSGHTNTCRNYLTGSLN